MKKGNTSTRISPTFEGVGKGLMLRTMPGFQPEGTPLTKMDDDN